MGWLQRLLGRGNEQAEQPASLQTISVAEYFADNEAWIPVDSSWVHSLAFYGQGAFGVLGVRFKDKKTGAVRFTARYDNVPVFFWQKFLDAPSKGKYVHQSGLYQWPYQAM